MTETLENKSLQILETIKNAGERLLRGCLVIPLIAVLAIIGLDISREGFENQDDRNLE